MKGFLKPYITAYAIVRESGRVVTNTIKVLVKMSGGIPTVPYVIKYEKDYYVRTETNPLTYTSATFGIAKK